MTEESYQCGKLLRQRDKEALDLLKLRLIVHTMYKLIPDNNSELKFTAENEKIWRVLKMVKINDYLSLSNSKESQSFLGLKFKEGDYSLSDEQREIIRTKLVASLRSSLKPKQAFWKKIQKEFASPVVDFIAQSENKSSPLSNILALEKKRCDTIDSLVKLLHYKSRLLKKATEIKIGPYLRYEFEIRCAEAQHNLMKAKALHGYLVHQYTTCTNYNYQAIKEVESSINEVYEEMHAEDNIKSS